MRKVDMSHKVPAFEVYPGTGRVSVFSSFSTFLIANAREMKAGWERHLGGGAVPQSWEEQPAWVLLLALRR